MAADRDPGDDPVPGADLFDGQVDHDEVDPGELCELRILHADPAVEHLPEDQDFTRSLSEPAQRHVGRRQRDGVGIDRGDPQQIRRKSFCA